MNLLTIEGLKEKWFLTSPMLNKAIKMQRQSSLTNEQVLCYLVDFLLTENQNLFEKSLDAEMKKCPDLDKHLD